MLTTLLRGLGVSGLVVVLGCAGSNAALAAEPPDPWPDLRRDVFNGRPLADGAGLIAIEMPYRAEDAAVVPVTLRLSLPLDETRSVKAVTLVIDQNPAPVAATFELGPARVSMISTWVRVDSYTNVHAVAELSDGTLHVAETFVKASGGCSAPAANTAGAKVNLGQMTFKQPGKPDHVRASRLREAEITIRHPNNSGLQMDQLTRFYTPAFFVRELRLWQGDELVLKMDAGISLSENPSIRFAYMPNGAARLRAEAVDTDGNRFTGEWPVEASGM